MTREEWVLNNRDEWNGIMLECMMSDRRGAELALALRGMMKKIDALLASHYDELTRAGTSPAPAKPASNGTAHHPAPRKS